MLQQTEDEFNKNVEYLKDCITNQEVYLFTEHLLSNADYLRKAYLDEVGKPTDPILDNFFRLITGYRYAQSVDCKPPYNFGEDFVQDIATG